MKSHYSTFYITLCSVLLGLCLSDIVGILRGAEEHTVLMWIQALFVVHLIFNAWVSFSIQAITVRLLPSLSDSFGVFLLAAGNFAMISFIGVEPHLFWFAQSVYSGIAIPVQYMNAARIEEDAEHRVTKRDIRPLTLCAIGQSLGGLLVGWLLLKGVITENMLVPISIAWFIFPSGWILMYNRMVTAYIYNRTD